MMKHHLNGGVSKGAFSQEEADKRFAAWLEEKQAKIQAKIDGLDKDKAKDLSDRLEAEKAVNQKRIEDLTAAPESEEAPATEEAPAAEASTVSEEAPATDEAPATEEAPAVEETPVAEEAPAVEETSAAEEAPQTEETSNEETESKE